MSKFLEDIKWQWEMQHSFSADKWEEMFRKLEKGEQLKAENKALRRPMEAANFKVDGMLAVGNELIERDLRIKELEVENERLQEYKLKKQSKLLKKVKQIVLQFSIFPERIKDE